MTTETPSLLDRVLAASAVGTRERSVDPDLVAAIVRDEFGLAGTLQRIATEKDDTFVLGRAGGAEGRQLVKVSSSYEDPLTVDLQSVALDHAAAHDPTLPLPRLRRARHGATMIAVGGGCGPHPRLLRVLSYLEGEPIGQRTPTPDQARLLGSSLARLSLALRGLEHRGADRLLIWDLQNLAQLRPLLTYVDRPELRTLVERVLDIFDGDVAPLLPSAEHQVLHDDFNRFNVLVDGAAPQYVTGIIDFGDVTRTAVALDLAVAAGSFLTAQEDPWRDVLALVDGYLEVRPLTDAELDIVAGAAPARVALRVLVTAYQRATDPERAAYLRSHGHDDLARLRALARIEPNGIRHRLQRLMERHRTVLRRNEPQ